MKARRWARPLLVALGGSIAAALFFPSLQSRLSAILPIVVAGATVAYALLTWELVAATEEMRSAQVRMTEATAMRLEAQIRPFVLLYMQLNSFIIHLVVENAGSGVARNIKLSVDGDLSEFPEQMVLNSRLIQDGLRYLAPRQRLFLLLANGGRSDQDRALAIR